MSFLIGYECRIIGLVYNIEVMLKILIIDDEKDVRDVFWILIDKFVMDIEIIGEVDGVKSGV